jgi:hypothetical protein
MIPYLEKILEFSGQKGMGPCRYVLAQNLLHFFRFFEDGTVSRLLKSIKPLVSFMAASSCGMSAPILCLAKQRVLRHWGRLALARWLG